jgi:hypothetical protein
MAPELFFVLDGTTEKETSPNTTKSSDVYSFALMVLEVSIHHTSSHHGSNTILDPNF